MSRLIHRVKQPGVYFVTTDTWQRRQIFLKPEAARILLEQLIECRDRGFYKLHSFTVMPEHLHVLLTPGEQSSLEKAMMMIKGGASHRIKKALQYQSPIWMEGFHDRWIRDLTEYRLRKQYIEQNPVKAGLAAKAADYALGSVSGKFPMDACAFDGGSSGAKAPTGRTPHVAPEGATHKA
jgi:REP element-mobilizing transposase RayT